MTKPRTLRVSLARALAPLGLVAIAACSAAPGEATGAATGAIHTLKCGPLQELSCDSSGGPGDGYGEGPGGSNVGGKVVLSNCVCIPITAPPDPAPPFPVYCSSTPAPAPSVLSTLGCTAGVTFTGDDFISASIWACPSGITVPPGINGLPACTTVTSGACETIASGPNIDNTCVGDATSNWILVESETEIARDASGGGCFGGCPYQ